jgi:hypothetical protein
MPFNQTKSATPGEWRFLFLVGIATTFTPPTLLPSARFKVKLCSREILEQLT